MRWYELNEKKEQQMSFWDIAEDLGIGNVSSQFHDGTLPWLNHNRPGCINTGIKNPEWRLFSKLKLWKFLVINKGEQYGISYAAPIGNTQTFLDALQMPVTLWRGGGGTYDPDFSRRSWVSFSAKRDRMRTFTYYDGTYGMDGFLPKRDGPFWIAELTLKLDDILLYLEHGQDNEVIVSRAHARQAKVVETGVADPKTTKW